MSVLFSWMIIMLYTCLGFLYGYVFYKELWPIYKLRLESSVLRTFLMSKPIFWFISWTVCLAMMLFYGGGGLLMGGCMGGLLVETTKTVPATYLTFIMCHTIGFLIFGAVGTYMGWSFYFNNWMKCQILIAQTMPDQFYLSNILQKFILALHLLGSAAVGCVIYIMTIDKAYLVVVVGGHLIFIMLFLSLIFGGIWGIHKGLMLYENSWVELRLLLEALTTNRPSLWPALDYISVSAKQFYIMIGFMVGMLIGLFVWTLLSGLVMKLFGVY